jgi:hypothetical protein
MPPEILTTSILTPRGDIFIGLPGIDISLEQVLLAGDKGEQAVKWTDLARQNRPVNIIVPVRPVAAIVATQDCDALRSRDVTLCEIREFREVEGKSKDTTSAKSWKNILAQHARINQKWFYLLPDSRLGFSDKIGVDFMVTLRVPRQDSEGLCWLRRGRLNAIADEHFRERIGEFFRRYPYDGWSVLNGDEFEEYKMAYDDLEPFPRQRPSSEDLVEFQAMFLEETCRYIDRQSECESRCKEQRKRGARGDLAGIGESIHRWFACVCENFDEKKGGESRDRRAE